jgi:translation initiation factor IF-3
LEDGSQAGVVPLSEALERAENLGFELVEISPTSNPPVCKIMDYGKYKFELRKKEREHKKKQTIVLVKELTMGPSIEEHDFQVKLKKAYEFLEEGHRVKLTVRFKGRQIFHKDLGEAVLKRFQEQLEEIATSDRGFLLEGKRLTMILQPKKK